MITFKLRIDSSLVVFAMVTAVDNVLMVVFIIGKVTVVYRTYKTNNSMQHLEIVGTDISDAIDHIL